jgi:putative ABC transport system permease protein
VAGVYARMAHGVVQRRREWAIRQAIGATPARLRRRIVGEIGGVAAAGVGVGLLALPLVAASGAALVYGADLENWPRAFAVGVAVGVAALVAGAAPARRVTGLDLTALLREE